MGDTEVRPVIFFIHSIERGGGIQTQRLSLVRAFIEQGIPVTVVVPKTTVDDISGYHQLEGLVDLKQTPGLRLFSIIDLIRKLARFLRTQQPSAVLSGGIVPNLLVALAVRLSRGRHSLHCTYHTPIRSGRRTLVGRMKDVFRAFMVRATVVLGAKLGANTQRLADELKSIAAGAHACFLPNPVIDDSDGSRRPAARQRVPGSPFRLISVGRLIRQKGMDILISSLPYIRADVTLTIVGTGPERAALEAQCRQLSVEEKVTFVEYTDDVIGLMSRHDLYVMASRFEGFGNVLVEALYAGLPVVAADCPHGPSEILEGGKHGRLVKSCSRSDLAEAVGEALQVPNERSDRWRDFTRDKSARAYLVLLSGEAG